MLMPSSVPPGPYTKRRLIKITRRLASTDIDGKVTRQVIEYPPIEQVYDTRDDFLTSMGVGDENKKLAQEKNWTDDLTSTSTSHRLPIEDGTSGVVVFNRLFRWSKDENGKISGEYTVPSTEAFYKMKPKTESAKLKNELETPSCKNGKSK